MSFQRKRCDIPFGWAPEVSHLFCSSNIIIVRTVWTINFAATLKLQHCNTATLRRWWREQGWQVARREASNKPNSNENKYDSKQKRCLPSIYDVFPAKKM